MFVEGRRSDLALLDGNAPARESVVSVLEKTFFLLSGAEHDDDLVGGKAGQRTLTVSWMSARLGTGLGFPAWQSACCCSLCGQARQNVFSSFAEPVEKSMSDEWDERSRRCWLR